MQTFPALNFDRIIPTSSSGFGVLQNTYSGGRVGVCVNHFGGINQILYWGSGPMHGSRLLFQGDASSSYRRCFRAQVIIGDEPYSLEFVQTEHLPFGYRSLFFVPALGVKIAHRLTLLNDAIVFSIEILQNKKNLPIRQRIEHHDYCFNPVHRTHNDWQSESGVGGWTLEIKETIPAEEWKKLQAGINQLSEVNYPLALAQGPREGTTRVTLLPTRGRIEMRSTCSGRRYFTSGIFRSGRQAQVLLFSSADRKAFRARARQLQKKGALLALERERAHERELATAPQFRFNDRVMESMLANIPGTLRSLFVEDVTGSARASSLYYWIWGWDTLTLADVHLLSGQKEFARDVLRFYRRTADPKWGVGHQFTTDSPPQIRVPMAVSAQMMYVIFLHQYGIHTGDVSLWKESYPFIRGIFEHALQAINKRGLGEGPALWPDLPHFCLHTGNDISIFNNSIQYQGVRCMEVIAATLGDEATAAKARQVSRRMEEYFTTAFWDRKRKYFVDSIDSKNGTQRAAYPAHALLWMTPFLFDLVGRETLEQCATFIAGNHATSRGFLPYPRWDVSFDGDGNQLGQVWPTADMFATCCEAAAGRQDVLQQWMDSSSWFWKQLTYIEGYSAQTVNDSGTPDCPGYKMNLFGTKTTYMAFLTGCAGVHFDGGGITLRAGISRPVRIQRLNFRGAVIDLSIRGEGRFVQLKVNGRSIAGTSKIPRSLLKGRVKIEARRTAKTPAHPVILTANGAEIDSVTTAKNRLTALVSNPAAIWLHFYAPRKVSVHRDGNELDASYNRKTGEGKVLLPPGARARIEIIFHPAE